MYGALGFLVLCWGYQQPRAQIQKQKGRGDQKQKEGPGSQDGRGGGISYLALAERSQPVRGPDNASVFVADCTCTRMLRFLRVFTVP